MLKIMTDLNEFLRNVTISDSNDSLVDEEEDEAQIQIDENAYPLQQRIYRHTTDCYNYLKHDGSKVKPGTKPTGQALLINEVNSLAVVDIDIKKDHDIVREDILLKLSEDDVVVQTGSGGLHVYCNQGDFKPASNRMIKIFT